MRQCAIKELNAGMVLGMPLHAYYGGRRSLLLGAGATLSSEIIKKVDGMGYSHVYIEEEGTEGLIPDAMLSDETKDSALLTLSHYYEQMRNNVLNLSQKGVQTNDLIRAETLNIHTIPTVGLRRCIRDLIQDLFIIGTVKSYHSAPGISGGNAIFNHVLNVSVLSLLIGGKYKFVDDEQNMLAMGAILHDIGKAVLLDIWGKRYWEMNEAERDLLRNHPALGEKILANVRTINEAERQIIAQHHERQDGTGYPFGLTGDNRQPLRTHYAEPNKIFRFAEIVAAANMFDDLTSGNYFAQRFSPKEGLEQLARESGTGLNSEVVKSMNSLITLYPLCSNVKITKHPDPKLIGFEGVVSESDRADLPEIELILLKDASGKRVKAWKERIPVREDNYVKLVLK